MAKMLKSPPRPQYRRTYIGEWIDHVGKTQRAVAAAAEISEPHMSLVIRGRRQYTQELLERIAAAIDPDIEPPMLLYPPTSKSMWGIWRDLSPEQRDQAVAMAEILRKKG